MAPVLQSLVGTLAFQVFSPNTNVGKTLISTALCFAIASQPKFNSKITYVKPLQTGSATDSDARFVNKFVPSVATKTLFSYTAPVSPHLATLIDKRTPVTAAQVVDAVRREHSASQQSQSQSATSWFILETAGGVLSPSTCGTPQSDVYRPLRFPTVLIGDPNLGGISTTLSAFESLHLRGYDIPCVVMFRSLHSPLELENHLAIEQQLRWANIPVFVLPPPPPPPQSTLQAPASSHTDTHEQDQRNLEQWFRKATPSALAVAQHLVDYSTKRAKRLSLLSERAAHAIWWPFTQHQALPKISVIDSAYGDNFSVLCDASAPASSTSFPESPALQELYDACGSWWTQGVGHGNSRLSLAAAHAAGRYGHVLFPENAHEPAVLLAEKLIDMCHGDRSDSAIPQLAATPSGAAAPSGHAQALFGSPNWASKVFFSDDGSTAMEIALKMAFRRRQADLRGTATAGATDPLSLHELGELKIIGITNAYHGDTIGTMDAANPTVFNSKDNWYRGRGMWFDPPLVYMSKGRWVLDVPAHVLQLHEPRTASTDERLAEFSGLDALFDDSRLSSSTARLYARLVSAAIDSAVVLHPGSLNSTVVSSVAVDASGRVQSQFRGVDSKPAVFGALVLEPIMQGAGGMNMIDPLFQKVLVLESRKRGIPVIFDEIFVGCYRLGFASTSHLLKVYPDISCFAKLLTGGLVPLAATVASARVFDGFKGSAKTDALLHGHSYTAHPVGCSAAVQALSTYTSCPQYLSSEHRMAKYWDESLLVSLSHSQLVERLVAMGSVVAVTLRTRGKGYASTAAGSVVSLLRETGVYARPLGNVVYLMCSPISVPASNNVLLEKLLQVLRQLESYKPTSRDETDALSQVVV